MSNKQQNTGQNQYQPDFEELLDLAKNDPELFEAKRLEYIEHYFTKVPVEKQQRLRFSARHLIRVIEHIHRIKNSNACADCNGRLTKPEI